MYSRSLLSSRRPNIRVGNHVFKIFAFESAPKIRGGQPCIQDLCLRVGAQNIRVAKSCLQDLCLRVSAHNIRGGQLVLKIFAFESTPKVNARQPCIHVIAVNFAICRLCSQVLHMRNWNWSWNAMGKLCEGFSEILGKLKNIWGRFNIEFGRAG